MSEVWKPVCGFEGYYEVSSLGRIRRPAGSMHRYKTELLMKPASCKGNIGYLYVTLKRTVNGVKEACSVYVHKAVCEAFHGERRQGFVVRHKDGDIKNCASDNLEWGTRSENERDKVRHGTSNVGRVRVRHIDGRYK